MADFVGRRLTIIIVMACLLGFIQFSEYIFSLSDDSEYIDKTSIFVKEQLEKRDIEILEIENNDNIPEQLKPMLIDGVNDKYEIIIGFGQQYNLGGENWFVSFFTINIPDAPVIANLILTLMNDIIFMICAIVIASYIYDGLSLIPFVGG
jgi:hypothetical protein